MSGVGGLSVCQSKRNQVSVRVKGLSVCHGRGTKCMSE